MKTEIKFGIFIVIVIIVVVGLGLFIPKGEKNNKENELDQLGQFAQCIKDSGAEFYGTFWCSYCQDQKNMFGSSKKYLPYIECSTPDNKEQTQICKDKEIKGYPTWIFADGSHIPGKLSFSTLAEKTQCQLPE